MDSTKAVTRHIGLCAGYGGIELGLRRVIRNLRTVALCEVEAFAVSNLVAKMEAGHLDASPIWTDLKTFPYETFHGRVDILTGGYPCQPFSAAGKRLGKEDPRHLWPHIARGIRLLQPRLCFFENVEGHISLGLSDVIEDLAGMGYRASWGIFSASECGAPHQRKRVFILAYRDDCGSREDIKSLKSRAGQTKHWPTPDTCSRGDGPSQLDRHTPTLQTEVKQWATPSSREWKGHTITDNHPNGFNLTLSNQIQPSGHHIPANDSNSGNRQEFAKLNPRWVETLMGLPVGWTMPSCASPVTTERMSCACLVTESSPQPPLLPSAL